MSDWREVETPKIWASRYPRYLDIVDFDWTVDAKFNGTSNDKKLEFVHASRYHGHAVEDEAAPKSLYYRSAKKLPKSTADAFRIVGGLMVVSAALRDLLLQFDVEGTQFFEVPIHADADGTPTDLPNHYVLHVTASKDALIPELSGNIRKPSIYGQTEPPPNATWGPSGSRDVVALNSSAAEGGEIWRIPNYKSTFFVSDRIKQAVDAAGLKTKALSFAPTRVFEKAD